MTEQLELKGKFLDAAALSLTQDQYCGLIKTLALLEAGKLDHENPEHNIHRFAMRHWMTPHLNPRNECGTICCIGGTACAVMGNRGLFGPIAGKTDTPAELRRVFYPTDSDAYGVRPQHLGWNATTKEAAMVLRNYLETGNADWDLPYRK